MTSCSDSLAPTDEELMSLVYEEATLPPQEQAHFDHCVSCQQRLQTYTGMTRTLQKRLYRRVCPGGGLLNYYCLGMVSEEERVSVASHLLDCPLCADEVVEIRRLQATFEAFPEAKASLRMRLPRLFATRIAWQPVAVTRSETRPADWPRQYRAGPLALSLHLSRQSNGEMMLLGILTSSDPTETVDAFEGLNISLYPASAFQQSSEESEELVLSTQVDDVGNLVLEAVPAGEYVLLIQLPDKEIVIDGLKIEH